MHNRFNADPVRPARLAATIFLLLAVLVLTLARPAFGGPADEGRELVQEKCQSCHEITSDSYGGPRPTMYEIAGQSRYWTPTRFEAWLSSAHGPMPEFRVTSQDIYNLMQYLERLRSDSGLDPAF
jgi:cytochrome c2